MIADVASLKEQVSLLDLVSSDTTLRHMASTGGGEYAGSCPKCGGNDRFRVWVGRNRFYCRGCGISGDAIAYLRDVHGLGFRDAVARLGGDSLPARNTPARQGTARPVPAVPTWPDPPRWRQAGEKIAREAHDYLMGNPQLLAYLHGRGLTDGTIKEFGIGYSDIPHRYGLDVATGYTVPLLDPNGTFYGILIRRPPGTPGDRYTAISGSHPPLMGRLTGKPAMLVTEGALDMALAWQLAGDLVDVATLGSCVGNPDPWAIHLLPYRRILLCLDLDENGEKGRRHWGHFKSVLHVRLPLDRSKGKDVTDFVLNGGDLRQWLLPLLPGQEKAEPPAVAMPEPAAKVEFARVPVATKVVDRSKLQELVDARKPMREAIDMARLDPRESLLCLAERCGFPRVRLNQSEHVLPGKENWETFLTYASAKDLREAEVALRALDGRGS